MKPFYHAFLEPLFEICHARRIVEVGAGSGDTTQDLIAYAQRTGAHLDVIEPTPSAIFQELVPAIRKLGRLHVCGSLEILADLEADVILLDGDHNWHTVFHELKLIEAGCTRRGTPFPVVAFHDIGWPYGRRDMYYRPEVIPPEFRQPFAQKGMSPGHTALLPDGGFNNQCHNAITEGGPRNGVLTGIEDFIAATDRPLVFETFPLFHGFGLLYVSGDPARDARIRELFQLRPAVRAMLERFESDYMQSQTQLQTPPPVQTPPAPSPGRLARFTKWLRG